MPSLKLGSYTRIESIIIRLLTAEAHGRKQQSVDKYMKQSLFNLAMKHSIINRIIILTASIQM